MTNDEMIQLPYWKKECYFGANGAQVEHLSKVGTISVNKKDLSDKDMDIPQDENIYVGILGILITENTPFGMRKTPKEIKFSIPDATSVEDAFGKYPKYAAETIAEIESQRQEAQKKMDAMNSQIVRAPADALNALKEAEPGNQSRIITG